MGLDFDTHPATYRPHHFAGALISQKVLDRVEEDPSVAMSIAKLLAFRTPKSDFDRIHTDIMKKSINILTGLDEQQLRDEERPENPLRLTKTDKKLQKVGKLHLYDAGYSKDVVERINFPYTKARSLTELQMVLFETQNVQVYLEVVQF